MCGTPGVRLRHVTRSYGRGPTLLVVENVPVWVCPHCGESYLTADTLGALDRIKAHRRKFAVPKRVAVARFARRRLAEQRGLTREWSRRARRS
ncbi:MAG: type II toxin-antitoxin system MqsA family antitoxin [Acidobacteria bacterium]|nr:type II toxin-antitoxin system MqsA family antitoxin [Acidobacteriota bacterium]